MAVEQVAPSQTSFKSFFIALIAVSVLGLGTGFGFGALFFPINEVATSAATSKEADETHGKKAKDAHGDVAESSSDAVELPIEDLVATPIPTIVTNLAGSDSAWVRLEGSILVNKLGKAKPEVLASSSAQQILAYLRTLKLSDIEGPTALHAITEDLNEVLRSLSEGQAQAILISSLVVE